MSFENRYVGNADEPKAYARDHAERGKAKRSTVLCLPGRFGNSDIVSVKVPRVERSAMSSGPAVLGASKEFLQSVNPNWG